MSTTEDHTKRIWIKYKSEYDYLFDKDDEERFFHTFAENYRFITNENNKINHAYKCELNCSAHINHAEYQSILVKDAFDPTLRSLKSKSKKIKTIKSKKSFDWRLHQVVPKVSTIKFFYKHNSLWTQPITDCVEAFYRIKKDKMVHFSSEQLNDKLSEVANVGIVGLTQWALLQAQNNGFYDNDSDNQILYRIDGYRWIKPKESSIKKALVNYGPAVINIDASEKSFRFYKSGIYNPTESMNKSTLNHAALLVGYDKISKKKYWIVKNSWGTDWGNEGYINIDNECQVTGVTTNAYVVY